jgi:hypothetical protein
VGRWGLTAQALIQMLSQLDRWHDGEGSRRY